LIAIVLFYCDKPSEGKYAGEDILGKWQRTDSWSCRQYLLNADQFVPEQGLADSGQIVVSNAYFNDTLEYLSWGPYKSNELYIGNRAFYEDDYDKRRVWLYVNSDFKEIMLFVIPAPGDNQYHSYFSEDRLTNYSPVSFTWTIPSTILFDATRDWDSVFVSGSLKSPGIFHSAAEPIRECNSRSYPDSIKHLLPVYNFTADGKYIQTFYATDTTWVISGTYKLENDSLFIYTDTGYGPFQGEITYHTFQVGQNSMSIKIDCSLCEIYWYNKRDDCLSTIEYEREYEPGSLVDSRLEYLINFQRLE